MDETKSDVVAASVAPLLEEHVESMTPRAIAISEAEFREEGLIVTKRFGVQTNGGGQVVDLNDTVIDQIKTSGVTEGQVSVFVTGTTASVLIMEHEPGLVQDLETCMERLAPRGLQYEHNSLNNDDNGHSHTRATLMGQSLVVPVVDGGPLLGTWQRIVLVDFDSRPRNRDFIVQVMGE